jgi:hypothetical protein
MVPILRSKMLDEVYEERATAPLINDDASINYTDCAKAALLRPTGVSGKITVVS